MVHREEVVLDCAYPCIITVSVQHLKQYAQEIQAANELLKAKLETVQGVAQNPLLSNDFQSESFIEVWFSQFDQKTLKIRHFNRAA